MEDKNVEYKVLRKIDEVAKSLERIQSASYTDKDLDNIDSAINELKEEVGRLEDNYHTLDKKTVTFLDKLNSLEKEIHSFEESEGNDEDQAKSLVTAVVSSLVTGIAAYILGQVKPW